MRHGCTVCRNQHGCFVRVLPPFEGFAVQDAVPMPCLRCLLELTGFGGLRV